RERRRDLRELPAQEARRARAAADPDGPAGGVHARNGGLVLSRLSLRARLLIGGIALATVGLAAADVATYSSLSSYLLGQVDSSLNSVHVGIVSRVFPDFGGPPPVPGDCVEVRSRTGTVIESQCFPTFRGSGVPPGPRLPAHVHMPVQPNTPEGDRVRFFTVPATSGSGRYRVRASQEALHPNFVLLIAASLRTEDSTLRRLIGIEVLVTV